MNADHTRLDESSAPLRPPRRSPTRSQRDHTRESHINLLTVDRAAEDLGIAPGALRNWISMKRIEHVKVGRLTRLAQATLDRCIAAHTVRAVDARED